MKRRTFIKNSSLLAGSVMLPSLLNCAVDQKKKSIGLQLYSLRKIIKADLPGTLKRVAEIGYKSVETYSYGDGKIFDVPFVDFVKIAKDNGLAISCGHYGTGFNSTAKGNLRNGWEKAVEDAKMAGQHYMVVPSLDKGESSSVDDYKKTCELLNKSGETCKQYGIKLGYHNHDTEFIKIEDQVPYDVMLAELDPSLVTMELDLYWIVRGGYNPLDYFKNYPGRFELWHVKDMNKTDRTKTTSPGSGSINFREIFNHAKEAGMKAFFVEIEHYEVSEYDSIKKGFDHLKAF
ncbi:MAG: sugar phosphate isomerase/epimerase [Cyclobacteriaceae bacterium]